MFCQHCGTENKVDDTQFCTKCGKPFVIRQSQVSEALPKPAPSTSNVSGLPDFDKMHLCKLVFLVALHWAFICRFGS